MAETADVVIIGGGIVGASVAFHLTQRGCTNIIIVEREPRQGLGSTGKSAGGVRAQFATPVNIRMSMYSIDVFANFEELTGQESGYKPFGYLFVATHPKHLDYLGSNRDIQVAAGLTGVEMLDIEDILKIIPQLNVDDVIGGSFCPTDGFVDPYSVMAGFTAKARQKGARLQLQTEVTGINVSGGRITGVETTRGPIATRAVVNASGPWAAIVAQLAGTEIPVKPLRRQLVHTQPFDLLPHRLPMVIDMSNGFHFRREGAGVLMAWPEPSATYGFDLEFDPDFIEEILTRAVARVPCFAEAQVNPSRCWAGLYEVTPDHHAIIGPSPEVEGFYLANGFSGHGVMHSPATGRIISELIVEGKSTLSGAEQLSVSRFSEGKLLEETAVL